MYNGIFDYQRKEDGTIELAIYNDNPLLTYMEEGRYNINDIVYVEPTEEFASGLTFIYQSHDDNYTGNVDGYDAELCEVIHAWQVSPFTFFAPGTNIDIEIHVITEDQITESMEWELFEAENGNTNNEDGLLANVYAAIHSLTKSKGESITLLKTKGKKFDIKAWIEKSKLIGDDIKEFIKEHTSEFSVTPSAEVTIGDVILKIYIPFLDTDSDYISTEKVYQLSFVPSLSWKVKTQLSIDIHEELDKILSDNIDLELNKVPLGNNTALTAKSGESKKANALKFKSLWIEGVDLKDKGIYPLAGQGYALAGTKKLTTNVHDMITQTGTDVSDVTNFGELNLFIGAVECLIFKPEGEASVAVTVEGGYGNTTMGIKLVPDERGGWKTEDFEEEQDDSALIKKITLDGKIGFDETKIGFYIMLTASFAGMAPFGFGPEVGISFDETHGELKANWERNSEGKYPLKIEKKEISGNIDAYAELALHARLAFEIAQSSEEDGDKKGTTIEFLPVDKEFFRHTFNLFTTKEEEIVNDTISIQVYNQKDEFRVCDAKGKDLEKTVHPTVNERGQYEFDCPEYILKQDDYGNEKAYKVIGLHINVPRGGVQNIWERISLPETLKTLRIDQILPETFKCDFSSVQDLEELYIWSSKNEIKNVDLSWNTKLWVADIASKCIEEVKLPENNELQILKIDAKNNGIFHELYIPKNTSMMKELQLKGVSIETLDVKNAQNLEKLILSKVPLQALNLDGNTKLKELNVKETDLKELDVSENADLEKLLTSSRLEKFTGNGKAMPSSTNLVWYTNEEKTNPIKKGYICKQGEVIYSAPYKNVGEEVTEYWNRTLNVDQNSTFRVADKYGNEITDWPGYDVEKGAVSRYQDESGLFNVKLPQYIIGDKGDGEHAYKVKAVSISCFDLDAIKEGQLDKWNLIDASEAPDIEALGIHYLNFGDNNEILGKLIIPQNLKKLRISDCRGISGPECEFDRAPNLEKIEMNPVYWKNNNFDFSQNNKLKTIKMELRGRDEEVNLSLKLPSTDELETIDIVKFPYKHEDDPIELTGLTGLKKLYLRGIGTDTIDLTDLEQLEELKLDDIPVKELDFSQCTNLKKLTLIETQVKHLDISNNLKLKPNKLELISNRTWSFTGNGEICPRGSWYKNPYELNPVPVSECARGETIYSRYFWMYYGGGANLKSNAQKDTAMTPSNAMKISD